MTGGFCNNEFDGVSSRVMKFSRSLLHANKFICRTLQLLSLALLLVRLMVSEWKATCPLVRSSPLADVPTGAKQEAPQTERSQERGAKGTKDVSY